MNELLPWDPAHPLCALVSRCDVLAAAWNRYRHALARAGATYGQAAVPDAEVGRRWAAMAADQADTAAGEFRSAWNAIHPTRLPAEGEDLPPPHSDLGKLADACRSLPNLRGAAWEAVDAGVAWLLGAMARSSWGPAAFEWPAGPPLAPRLPSPPQPLYAEWSIDDEFAAFPPLRVRLLRLATLTLELHVPAEVRGREAAIHSVYMTASHWQRTTPESLEAWLYDDYTGQPAGQSPPADADLIPGAVPLAMAAAGTTGDPPTPDPRDIQAGIEFAAIAMLRAVGPNVSEIARRLGIKRQRLYAMPTFMAAHAHAVAERRDARDRLRGNVHGRDASRSNDDEDDANG